MYLQLPIKFAYFQKSFVKSKREQYSNYNTYMIFREKNKTILFQSVMNSNAKLTVYITNLKKVPLRLKFFLSHKICLEEIKYHDVTRNMYFYIRLQNVIDYI